MMDITHAATGAVVGSKIDNIYLVVLLSIVLHFLVDKIPHFWPSTLKGKIIIYSISYTLTIIFLLSVLLVPLDNKTNIIIAALVGVLIDILLLLIPIVKKSKIAIWHSKRQAHLNKPQFLMLEVIMITASLLIIFK